MVNRRNIFVLLLSLLFLNGCFLFQKKIDLTKPVDLKITKDLDNASERINKNTKIIEEKTTSINKETEKIQSNTEEVKTKVPENSKENIIPHLDNINNSSKSIIEDTYIIKRANDDIIPAKEDIETAKNKVKTTDDTIKISKRKR